MTASATEFMNKTMNEEAKGELALMVPSEMTQIGAVEAKQPRRNQGQAGAKLRRSAGRKTIVLCMIVKNEAPVIRRCLDSVRSIIDCWVIVDTGSSDGTQDIIREHLKDLPGELHERPWRDFAYNRSEALALARPRADYSLIIDADDTLEVQEGFQFPELTADAYMLDIQDPPVRYQRMQLVRNTLPWHYKGVLHEFPTCEGSGPPGHLPIVMRRNHDGARRRDPETYRKDAAILENALLAETDPFLIARYTFYLAQSYFDCGEKAKAIEAYLRRAGLGYWDQEVFFSLYKAAQLKEELGHDRDEVVALYLRAFDAAPNRVEALHGASRLCRNAGRNQQGYEIAKRGLELTTPTDGLFVEPWIYEYGLLDELAVNAYWTGRYTECVDACDRLLSEGKLPAGDRDRVLKNKNFAVDKIRDADASAPETDAFLKLLRAARQKEELGRPSDEVISAYMDATAVCPTRAEALHGAARYCRHKSLNERGYEFAAKGLAIAHPNNAMAVEDWIYEYGSLDELAVNAYWTERYAECADACDRLLSEGKLPTEDRDRVLKNKQFALDKLQQRSASPSVPLATPAVATSRVISGTVSVITPTRNRHSFLKNALTYFRSQDYKNIEWHILDDSPQGTESLNDIDDRNIFYQHVDRQLPIGEKRNILIEKAKGEVIVQFDDDDYYAPNYVRSMIAALTDRDADMINLRGWFLYDVRSHFFGYWDLMQKTGPHYCCDWTGVTATMFTAENNRALEKTHFGYGFSYIFKKQVWEAVKFPAINWNEDGEFSLHAQCKFKVAGVHDTTGLCLHILHPHSTSRCYPQYHIPKFLFQRLFPALEYQSLDPMELNPRSETEIPGPARVSHLLESRSSWVPGRPLGGTELMVEGLRQRLGGALDPINLCVNSYEEAHIDDRPLVVWVHLDVDQIPTQWFYDKEKVRRVARFVFVSDWQKSRFIERFELRPEMCVVLRNATEVGDANRRWKPGKPLRIAYTTVPYRGLSVLLDAWDHLRPVDSELHIWSSIKLYGPRFNDEAYRDLYDRALSLPGIEYHGIVPNPQLRAALRSIDFLAYPSIVPETSFISAIEAMAAGCRVICPSLGALPETTGQFARLYPFPSDPADHAKLFAEILADEIRNPWGGNFELSEQEQNYARGTYDWSVRIAEWQAFIRGIASER